MTRPIAGIGVGLRIEFARDLFADGDAPVDFVEVHPENFVDRGGAHATMLTRALGRFPVLTHGLTMGFANADPPTAGELERLRRFLDRVDAPFHSDHLCFGADAGRQTHELLPPPFDSRTVALAAERIEDMRAAIGRPVAIENVSYYVPPPSDPLDEIEAIRELLARSDGRLLLDVNNVVVNAHNHGFDPRAWLARVPYERVVQIHVAGHFVRSDGLRIDTHGATSSDEVRDLLGEVLARTGPVPVLLERDAEFPAYEELRQELLALRAIYDASVHRAPRARETASAPRLAATAEPRRDRKVVDHLFARSPVPVGEGLVAQRWHLYRAMARGRLHDLVAGVFGRTREALGAQAFDSLFASWLEEAAPSSPIFWRTADEFGGFVLERLGRDDSAIRDRLAYERIVWRVRQAPYPEPGRYEALDLEHPAVLQPAHECLALEHPVHLAAGSGDEAPRHVALVVFRGREDALEILELNPLAEALLVRLRAPHESVAAVLRELAAVRELRIGPALLESIAETLAQWHALGLLLGSAKTA